jgi:uncharacterized protein DUF1203
MSQPPSFRIVPIDAVVAERARHERRSPQYGHPASVELAKGYGPCRSCLRVFREGEENRLLFTFNPVPASSGLPQPGPIFIHDDACVPFDGDGVPPDLRELPLFLEGFGRGSWLVRRAPVELGDVEAALAALGGEPALETILIRNAEAGCFIARVERA